MQQHSEVFSYDKASFFDDIGLIEEFTFWKNLEKYPRRLSEVKQLEGILFKRSKKTSFWKSRYYVLFDDRLSYFKNGREKKETAYCLLQNMRLEKIINKENEKDEKFGIRLIHNRKYIELYARSSEVQDKWLSKLKQYCILTDYASNYSETKMIGEGSFAKVYLVKRKADSADMAVKTFDKTVLGKVDKAKASLINEVNIMRKLDHENIIKLHEVHESESKIHLVLELLHGGELFERIIKKGIYTEKDASILMSKLLGALDAMHSKNIMHRDIKPENLILKDMDNNYDVKIADFGLATVVTNSDYLFRRCGTPGYVAPEILADEKYDQKVDVFSAGVILYILLTGGSPFHGKSYNEILIKNKNCDIRFNFKEGGHQISPAAIDLLKKMLQKDPKQRISAREAMNNEWVVSRGAVAHTEKPQLAMLSSAQENMKKFQEHHRFNVKNIKPKDLDNRTAMERAIHCPSPIINGRITTVIESRHTKQMVSPKKSMFSANGEVPPTCNEEVGQEDEQPIIGHQMNKYNNKINLLTTIKDSNNSTNSSVSNTPLAKPKADKGFVRKAINIQGNLLNLIKPNNNTQNSGFSVSSYYKDEKKTTDARNKLSNLI